jgi:hypothetical protein
MVLGVGVLCGVEHIFNGTAQLDRDAIKRKRCPSTEFLERIY